MFWLYISIAAQIAQIVHDILTVFLINCCLDCPKCPAIGIHMGQAVLASWAVIKKYSLCRVIVAWMNRSNLEHIGKLEALRERRPP